MGSSASLDSANRYVDSVIGSDDFTRGLGPADGESSENGGGERGLTDKGSSALIHDRRIKGSSYYFLKCFDLDFPIVAFQGRTTMNLQAKLTIQRNVLLGFGEVNRLFAIQPNFYHGTLCPNPQFVPFPLRIDPGVDFFLRGLSEHFSSSRLVVQKPPNGSLAPTSDVTLIADHFVMLRNALAPELNACVVSRADQFGFEA